MLYRSPLTLKDISLSFTKKDCFQNVSRQIPYGKHIGIVGKNGSGKTTLLKIIQGIIQPTSGTIIIPSDVTFGYVPQISEEFETLSGGQRFNKAFTQALAKDPNILCLDEPTNHLDAHNRKQLMKTLQHYQGTLLVVSHDPELLRNCVSEIWFIKDGKIEFLSGNYDGFVQQQNIKNLQKVQTLETLKKDLKKIERSAQSEIMRAARSKRANMQENDRNLKERMKETASRTTGKNKGRLNKITQDITEAHDAARLPEAIKPHFHFDACELHPSKAVVSITNGSCGYQEPILTNIRLQIMPGEHIALKGDNGSGKTTLVKAILMHPDIQRSGDWHLPKQEDIGYLDQHYQTLNPQNTVFETIQHCVPTWTTNDIRRHLNDFLFRKNEEVTALVATLSGGEKARLSLALISAQSPKLLILDEVTNNLDLETREHVLQVLREYPGTLIVISHDEDFLEQIGIDASYLIQNGTIR